MRMSRPAIGRRSMPPMQPYEEPLTPSGRSGLRDALIHNSPPSWLHAKKRLPGLMCSREL